MSKYKSDHTVGEAIAILQQHDPDAELWVQGDGLCVPWSGEFRWIGSAVVLTEDKTRKPRRPSPNNRPGEDGMTNAEWGHLNK